jgi:glycosyltransferase 2 family protein
VSQPVSEKRSKSRQPHRILFGLVALVLAGLFLWLALRGIEWHQVWSLLNRANVPQLCAVMVAVSLALLLRALRWRVLLSAESQVPIPRIFWATAAGYFGNNVLPARAGELIRTLIVGRTSSMSAAFVLTTALSERISDGVVLIIIAAAVLFATPEKVGWLANAAKPIAALGAIGVVLIALLPFSETMCLNLLSRLRVPDHFRTRIREILVQVLRALRSFHNLKRFAQFASLTAVIWSIDGLVTLGTAHAMGLAISVPAAFLLLAGLGLSSALPSTPGYVGVYQFVAVSLLTPFGLSRTDAIAFVLLLQAAIYVPILFWGGIGLFLYRDTARLRAKDV